jgi:predicted phosphohydrolase
MIISDTHEHCYDGTTMPDVDVLIHTGDMTNFGELESLRKCVEMLGTFTAELKLVIAGNHDITLDKTRRVENMSDEEYKAYHDNALEIMTGPSAKEAGVTYLEEGTYTFTLRNGAKFTLYASPYTPGSGGWGFPYQPLEDRFNDATQIAPGRVSVATLPIPSGVDMVMTHGPPQTILDEVEPRQAVAALLWPHTRRTRCQYRHVEAGWKCEESGVCNTYGDGTDQRIPIRQWVVNQAWRTNSHDQLGHYDEHC